MPSIIHDNLNVSQAENTTRVPQIKQVRDEGEIASLRDNEIIMRGRVRVRVNAVQDMNRKLDVMRSADT